MKRNALVALTLAWATACGGDATRFAILAGGRPAAAATTTRSSTDESVPSSRSAPASGTDRAAVEPAGERESGTPAEPEIPKGTLVLHVGDSFAAALGIPLGKRLKEAGVRYVLEYQTASYVPTWAFGEDLPKFVGRYNPDFVIVTLGANEIEIPNPEQRAGAVKRLVKGLGDRPCLWILPPLWKKDTGFMKVIADNAAPCRCLDSTVLMGDLPRKRDKIHPSDAGRELWADAVMAWIAREREPNGERPWSLKAPR